MYVSNLSSKSSSYWPKIALLEQMIMKPTSPFMKYLKKWKDATQTYGVTPKQIRKNVKHYAIKDIKQSKFDTCTTSFALNCPGTTTKNHWFRPKPWITDSSFTKIFSEFRLVILVWETGDPPKMGDFTNFVPCVQLMTNLTSTMRHVLTITAHYSCFNMDILGTHVDQLFSYE